MAPGTSVLGVDPGAKGASASLSVLEDNEIALFSVDKFRSMGETVEHVWLMNPDFSVMEDVNMHACRGKGVWSFAKNVGWWEAALYHPARVPSHKITPTVWKRFVGIPVRAGKDMSVEALLRSDIIIPKDLLDSMRNKSDLGWHDGMVESILIGAAWIRINQGLPWSKRDH